MNDVAHIQSKAQAVEAAPLRELYRPHRYRDPSATDVAHHHQKSPFLNSHQLNVNRMLFHRNSCNWDSLAHFS